MSDEPNARSGQYIVVARRYRPQGFEDLVGQGMVSQALKNAIETDRVGHAYLFTGARGVGKTSTARILSKSLNCKNGPTATPCHECDICEAIAAGEDVDVLEIDGASNRGIDEIRQLRSNVSVRPSRARYKIYIIDEVHMLTKEAFNALLKTLEEPPEHVKFIFCTTDPEKIPITVLSRCQRFDFSPVAAEEIVTRLQSIVESEGSEADEDALRLLARKAAGSVRDSQSLLEQLLSFTSGRITVDAVHGMLGTAGSAQLYGLVKALAIRSPAQALTELDKSLGEGVDAGQLTEQLLGCLRDLMALSVGGGKELLLHSPEGDAEELAEIANGFGTANLLAAAQIVDQALMRMRLVTHSRVLLETALIRIAQLEDLQALSDLISQVQSGASGAVAATPSAKKKTPSEPVISPAVATETKAAVTDSASSIVSSPKSTPSSEAEQKVVRVDEPHTEASESTEPAAAATKETVEVETSANTPASSSAEETPSEASPDAKELWQKTVAQLDGITADIASNFVGVRFSSTGGSTDATSANSGPKRVVVCFPGSYNSSKSYCERPERHSKLEEIASKIAGTKVKLEFEIRADQAHETPTKPAISARQREREIAQRAFVQRAVEIFSGDITSIKAS